MSVLTIASIEKYCTKALASIDELASVFNISIDNLKEFIIKEKNTDPESYIKHLQTKTKLEIKEIVIEKAREGDPRMLSLAVKTFIEHDKSNKLIQLKIDYSDYTDLLQ
jgi:hypothetical protein